jgi:ABC-type lipoprotein export system ATPase subunit
VSEREKALLLVTHNRFIADACDWVHEMKDGLIIASHPRGERISVS